MYKTPMKNLKLKKKTPKDLHCTCHIGLTQHMYMVYFSKLVFVLIRTSTKLHISEHTNSLKDVFYYSVWTNCTHISKYRRSEGGIEKKLQNITMASFSQSAPCTLRLLTGSQLSFCGLVTGVLEAS